MARRTTVLVCALAVGLGGCVAPGESVTKAVDIGAVADRIQCDLKALYEAQLRDRPWLYYWAVSFNLTVKQHDAEGLTPSFGYRSPIASHRTIGLGAGADFSRAGSRTLTMKRTFLLRKLPTYDCKEPDVAGSPLTQSLGLLDPINDALSAHRRGSVFDEKPEELGYRLDFSFKAEGNVNPILILYRVTGLGVDVSASQERTNSLEIAFTDASPKTEGGAPGASNVPRPPRRPTASTGPGDTPSAAGRGPALTPEVRYRLDNTLQRLQLETLLPRRF